MAMYRFISKLGVIGMTSYLTEVEPDAKEMHHNTYNNNYYYHYYYYYEYYDDNNNSN